MHRFYAPDITTTMLLPDEEAQHCVRVLRLKEGEEVEVVDGKGHLHLCRILNATAKKLRRGDCRHHRREAPLGMPHHGGYRSDKKYGPHGMDGGEGDGDGR